MEHLKVLITYAVQDEFVPLNDPKVEPYYLRTGIGKVKSTLHLARAIEQVQPHLVLNIGTAGSIHRAVGEVVVCRRFVDRDMATLSQFGVESQIDSSALLAERGYCLHWVEEGVCNTGDRFVTQHEPLTGDVVDMEAYAQAFVCRELKVPFVAVKYVTDIIGQNSVKQWEEKLGDARAGLSHYLNVLKERI
ncbi:MAG: nucleosidase [Bacteroides sp.]|nr:nucleosidase [Bacteroides sp.]